MKQKALLEGLQHVGLALCSILGHLISVRLIYVSAKGWTCSFIELTQTQFKRETWPLHYKGQSIPYKLFQLL